MTETSGAETAVPRCAHAKQMLPPNASAATESLLLPRNATTATCGIWTAVPLPASSSAGSAATASSSALWMKLASRHCMTVRCCTAAARRPAGISAKPAVTARWISEKSAIWGEKTTVTLQGRSAATIVPVHVAETASATCRSIAMTAIRSTGTDIRARAGRVRMQRRKRLLSRNLHSVWWILPRSIRSLLRSRLSLLFSPLSPPALPWAIRGPQRSP